MWNIACFYSKTKVRIYSFGIYRVFLVKRPRKAKVKCWNRSHCETATYFSGVSPFRLVVFCILPVTCCLHLCMPWTVYVSTCAFLETGTQMAITPFVPRFCTVVLSLCSYLHTYQYCYTDYCWAGYSYILSAVLGLLYYCAWEQEDHSVMDHLINMTLVGSK